MPTLSRFAAEHPGAIDAGLSSLQCSGAHISEIDVEPGILAVLLSRCPSPFVQACLSERSQVTRRVNVRFHKQFCGADKSTLNIAICHSLSTINLRGNLLQSILGVAVFKNVRWLNLANNNIHTISACEPFSSLSHLEELHLSGNPVAALVNFRAHIIRICSTGDDLASSVAYCTHLRMLNSNRIGEEELMDAYQKLKIEEAYFVPALRSASVASVVASISMRLDIHHEMRQKGHVIVDLWQPLSFTRIVTLCVDASNVLNVPVDIQGHVAHQLRRSATSYQNRHAVAAEEQSREHCIARAATEASSQCLHSLFSLAEKVHAPRAVAVQWYITAFGTPHERSSAFGDILKTIQRPHLGTVLLGAQIARRARTLRSCLKMWADSLDARRHYKHAVLVMAFRSWRLKHDTNVVRRNMFMQAQRFIAKRLMSVWKRRLHQSKREYLCLFRPHSVGSAVARLSLTNTNPNRHNESRQEALRIVLSVMRKKCFYRSTLRKFFHRWVEKYCVAQQRLGANAAVVTPVDLDIEKSDDTTLASSSSRQEADPVASETSGCATHVNTVDSAVQCDLAQNLSPHLHESLKLCELLQRDKLRLVQYVAQLEKELADKSIQARNLAEAFNVQTSELRAVSIDRDQAQDAVSEYERERMVHLSLIKQLTFSQSK